MFYELSLVLMLLLSFQFSRKVKHGRVLFFNKVLQLFFLNSLNVTPG